MYFDGFVDVAETAEDTRAVTEGPTFPLNPRIGELFRHTTHGLCIHCADSNWRKVLEQ